MTHEARLLVVSNRLPVTIKQAENSNESKWSFSMSSGGLVSALSGLKKMMSFIWIGWPGFEVEDDSKQELSRELLEKYSCQPVFLNNEVADMYYNGFSNSTLWPLFHYLPGEIEFDEAQWDAYYRANYAFALSIKQIARDGDMIWVQDYHLMILPALLRDILIDMPNIRIGFFLHTPFPSSEVYRVLPVRTQLLLGILQCDLIGFHTYDYARHFLSACSRILNLSTKPNGVEYGGRFVTVGTFPIGIDTEKFLQSLESESVQEKLLELEGQFKGKKIMVGIDRLDYIKGVPHKLHAFDQFLTKYPEFRGKVVLVQIAVPTRTEVEEYKNLRTCVNELVGRINSKYSSFDYTPVKYLYRSVSADELVALYRLSDVCVVTSTRDGMNLVSYEYIVTQKDKNGVLILSEFAGAAQSMNGAIIVNPWNLEELVESYQEALTMDPALAKVNHDKLFKYVTKHTASYWGMSFVGELQKITADAKRFQSKTLLNPTTLKEIFSKDGKNRLLLFDGSNISQPQFVEELKRISCIPGALVYVLGDNILRDSEMLANFGNVGLVCEDGSLILHPIEVRLNLSSGNDWIDLAEHIENKWKDIVSPIIAFYTCQTPGSYILKGEKIIAWCFEEADQEYGSWQASELQVSLERMLSHEQVSVIMKNNKLEIRPSLIDLGCSVKRILSDLSKISINPDLIAYFGNDNSVIQSIEGKSINNVFIASDDVESNSKYHFDNTTHLTTLLSSLHVS